MSSLRQREGGREKDLVEKYFGGEEHLCGADRKEWSRQKGVEQEDLSSRSHRARKIERGAGEGRGGATHQNSWVASTNPSPSPLMGQSTRRLGLGKEASPGTGNKIMPHHKTPEPKRVCLTFQKSQGRPRPG